MNPLTHLGVFGMIILLGVAILLALSWLVFPWIVIMKANRAIAQLARANETLSLIQYEQARNRASESASIEV